MKIESDVEGEDLSELFVVKVEAGPICPGSAKAPAVKGDVTGEGTEQVKIKDAQRGRKEDSAATECIAPKRLKNQKFFEQANSWTAEEIQGRIAFLQWLCFIFYEN